MSEYFYARIDENSICQEVRRVPSPQNEWYLIPINSMDEDYIFRKYDGATQTWSQEKYGPLPPPTQPSQEERITTLETTVLEQQTTIDDQQAQINALALSLLDFYEIPE